MALLCRCPFLRCIHRQRGFAWGAETSLPSAGAGLAWPGAGLPQAKVYRVGLLSGGPPISDTSEDGAALIRDLAQRGYALGRNVLFERRGAMGHPDQLRQLAQDLAAAKVDVIVTWGYPAALAAHATGLPTVTAFGVGDPVATGLIASLARPGRQCHRSLGHRQRSFGQTSGAAQGSRPCAAPGHDAVERGRPRHDAPVRSFGVRCRETGRQSAASWRA